MAERITVQADDVATAFADVNAILTEEGRTGARKPARHRGVSPVSA
ncbi:MAG: hypothetical protein R2856_03385 [Caldilineaceae bacterium]